MPDVNMPNAMQQPQQQPLANPSYGNNPNLPPVPPEFQNKNMQVHGQMDKPTLKRRVMDFLMSDKLDSMGNYLFYCVFGPSMKNLLWQLGAGALSMTLFGSGPAGAPGGMTGGGSYVPGYGWQPARRDPYPYQNQYNGWTQPQQNYGYGYAQPQPAPMPQQQPGLNDISFNTRDDAWLVLDRLGREIGRYGKVRVADFYAAAGFTAPDNWALQGAGWTSLANVQPTMRTDGRWVIPFPQPVMVY